MTTSSSTLAFCSLFSPLSRARPHVGVEQRAPQRTVTLPGATDLASRSLSSPKLSSNPRQGLRIGSETWTIPRKGSQGSQGWTWSSCCRTTRWPRSWQRSWSLTVSSIFQPLRVQHSAGVLNAVACSPTGGDAVVAAKEAKRRHQSKLP